MATISTGTKTLDALMDGGLKTKVPTILFGIPDLGKTWFCFQMACMCTRPPSKGGLGKKVLYLDTESFFFTEDTRERFLNYFKKRCPDIDEEKLEIVCVEDIYELGKLFGIVFEIRVSEARITVDAKFPTARQIKLASKGKSQLKETLRDAKWYEHAPLFKKLSSGEYGLVVIDSITVPIKSVIPTQTQNFPARTSILTILLGAAYAFAKKFDVAFLITNHITRSPMSPGYRYGVGDPWGGQNIVYYVKHIFGLYRPLKDQVQKYAPDGHRVRRFERYRYPGLEREVTAVMLAKNLGYVDLPSGGAKSAT